MEAVVEAAHSVRIAMNFFGRGAGLNRLSLEVAELLGSFRESRTHHARVATGAVTGSGVTGLA
jgi:hypothetical protein